MKKITLLFAVVIALSSCSNDDDKNKNQEFFNLQVGNVWVYKKYYVSESRGASYLGTNDTVKVAGIETIDGKEYYSLTHTDDMWRDGEFLRLDDAGHLVYSTEKVLHSGTDKTYKEVRPFMNFGTMSYTLENSTNVDVEGRSYKVYPFLGYFTPNEGVNVPEGEASVDAYQEGVGFVLKRYRYMAAQKDFVEYRLISYDLK